MAQAAASDTLHDIHFGASFLAASAATNGSSPQDALYSVKYAQKPASLDTTAPGRLWTDAAASSTVYASFPATATGAASGSKSTEHRFAGKVEPAKEVDCVLIWDEDLQSFSLERLEGSLRLAVDRESHVRPTPSLSAAMPTPRPPAPSSLAPSTVYSSARPTYDADVASSGSSDSEDSEIRVPSVPPAHLRKLASEKARQALMRKEAAAAAAEASTSDSGREAERGRSRVSAGVAKKQDPEIEDFGDIFFGGGATTEVKATPAATQAPVQPPPKPAPLSLPASRSSTPTGRPAAPKPTPPAPAPVPPPTIQPPLSLPTKASPPRPTPQPPQPAPPPAVKSASASAPRPPAVPPAAVASKRPPTSSARASKTPSKTRPSVASKIPASSTDPASPKKSKRRSSVAQKSVPLSKATVSSSEGSSDGASSDDSSGSGSGSEEEDTGIPEGYLARPGSVLSTSAGGSAAPRPPARKMPMKAPPAVVVSDSASGSGSGSDSDESDDMEVLASSINNSLSGPAVGPGRVQGQVGKGKGGAKRASKIPASAGVEARAGYASKVPASMRSSLASKIPASSSSSRAGGARAQKGPARPGFDVDAARQREREDDVPDSESEED